MASESWNPVITSAQDLGVRAKLHGLSLLGPRYPGPHENRRTQQRGEDSLASAIFVGARRGDDKLAYSLE